MSLIISAVFDGPLPGGIPKGVELFATADIPDLSIYGLGSANNGGGTDGEEFTFPAVSANKGDYIYVASESLEFANFFGFAPDHTSGAMSINGDDAIELFENGSVIDLFGDINTDGTGEPWEYLDGWAARKLGSAPSAIFAPADWTFSGPNALDGETTNASAATPVPIARFISEPVFTINEVDADTPGTDSAEFIELYDGGIGNSSLDGMVLVLFNGSDDASYTRVDLNGQTTDANGFFVVGSSSVPNVDLVAFTTNGIQNGADAVALYLGAPSDFPNDTPLTTANLIDAIVYDTDDSNDSGLLTGLGQSVQFNENENGDKDNHSNARDVDGTGTFVAQTATPGETNVLPTPPAATPVKIHEIQGDQSASTQVGTDDISPLIGQIVSIQAIVTADFQGGGLGTTGSLGGFYVQEEEIDYDLSDLTSEGIFIFDNISPAVDVAIGDLVTVTGTVSEFFGETQITASTITIDSSGNSLPSATTVNFPVASAYLDDDGDPVANLEAYEGMRITIPQDMVLTEMFNLDRFGESRVSTQRDVQFTQDNDPSTTGFAAHLQDLARSTIILDDGSSAQNPDPIKIIDGGNGILDASDTYGMGDTITDITGTLSYSFDEFRIHAGTGTYADANPREASPSAIGGDFKVASLNVLNFFTTLDDGSALTDTGLGPRGADDLTRFTSNSVLANTDPNAEFDRQLEKLVGAITAIDADVLGLVELENDNDDATKQALVDAVNVALGSTVYDFIPTGLVGGDAIQNGFIYKIGSVTPLGSAATLTTFGTDNFLDPLGAGRDLNRPAIAQTFQDISSGEKITLAVNHLKSKGSLSGVAADNDQGDGQGNNNATRDAAAQILADWLASDPTGQGAVYQAILGDLNAYAKEDPIKTLEAAGFTDLARSVLGDAAYSFVFDGQIGTLDYVMANAALTAKLAGATEWHINADEPDAFDYNLDFGRNSTLFDGTSAHRNSDHDPVIVGFAFDTGPTEGNDNLDGTPGNDVISLLGGDDIFRALGGDDIVNGDGGADTIRGNDGSDTINGGADDDLITGGNNDDSLDGGAGADLIYGNGGADAIAGGTENDLLYGGAGDDTALGGAGDDDIRGQGGADSLSGDAGMDTLRGGSGDDTLSGGDDADLLFGNGNNDSLMGDGGDDTLQGAAGLDTLEGGAGADRLTGGDGDDSIDGGTGADTMNGGAGVDRFVFKTGYETDRINGYEQGIDAIELDAMLWAGNASIVTGQDVVDTFGTSNGTGSVLTLTFMDGDMLEIQNASGITAATLGADITFV